MEIGTAQRHDAEDRDDAIHYRKKTQRVRLGRYAPHI